MLELIQCTQRLPMAQMHLNTFLALILAEYSYLISNIQNKLLLRSFESQLGLFWEGQSGQSVGWFNLCEHLDDVHI